MIAKIAGKIMNIKKIDNTSPQLYLLRLEQETANGHFPVFVKTEKNTVKQGATVELNVSIYQKITKEGKAFLNVREV